jgi:hypothetical protein
MSNPIHGFQKDPAATLDYALDWSRWLPAGETLGAVVWTVPEGLELVEQSETGTLATVVLSGGTAGETYRIGCRITTTPGGLEDERSISMSVTNR